MISCFSFLLLFLLPFMYQSNLEPRVIWAPCQRYGRQITDDHIAHKEPNDPGLEIGINHNP